VVCELNSHRLERGRSAEQEVCQRAGVDDDQRRSRASRMTDALDGPAYAVRVRIRSASSGTVGSAASSVPVDAAAGIALEALARAGRDGVDRPFTPGRGPRRLALTGIGADCRMAGYKPRRRCVLVGSGTTSQ
jgi:hypothetical protein